MTGLVALIFCLNYFKWLCVDPRNIYFVSEQPHQRSMFWLLNHEKIILWSRISSGVWTSCWPIFWRFYQNFWGNGSETKSPTEGKKFHFWVWRHVCVWKRVHFSPCFYWRGKIFHPSANHIFYMTDRCRGCLQSPNSRHGIFLPFMGNFPPLLAPKKLR